MESTMYHYVLGLVHSRGFATRSGVVSVDPGSTRDQVLAYLLNLAKKNGMPGDCTAFSFSLEPNAL